MKKYKVRLVLETEVEAWNEYHAKLEFLNMILGGLIDKIVVKEMEGLSVEEVKE